MPFEIAHPVRPPLTPRFTEQQAWVQYPPDPVRRYENPMLAYALVFYAWVIAGMLGYLPAWATIVFGAIFLLRFFNRFHELIHADTRGAPSRHPARQLLILMGPLHLGYREHREMHLLHHREEGSPRDPDYLTLQPSGLVSLLFCFLQPELFFIEYVRRYGVRRVAPGLAVRLAVYLGLMFLGGWTGFILYNATVRLGNTIAWFVFGWVLHGRVFWGQVRPPRFPEPLASIWVLLVGRENLYGMRFHFLHHVFPHIPDRHLPEVSRRLII